MTKITQEQLDSLKQLDRIEYRLIEQKIERETETMSYNEPIFLFGFVLIISLLLYLATGVIPIALMKFTVLFVALFISYILIYNVVMIIKKIKLNEFLFNKYFKVEVKNETRKSKVKR